MEPGLSWGVIGSTIQSWEGSSVTTISVGLLARDRLFRESLVGLLTEHAIRVCWQASTVASLNRTDYDETTNIIILDISSDAGHMSEKIDAIRDEFKDSFVLALSDDLEIDTLAEAMKRGVSGYLLKEISGAALVQSLRLVLLGEKVFPSRLATYFVDDIQFSTTKDNAWTEANPGPLSSREKQILACLVAGSPNKVIASQLGIADATVKVHLKTILRKINAQNRTQAAIWAISHGMTALQSLQSNNHPNCNK